MLRFIFILFIYRSANGFIEDFGQLLGLLVFPCAGKNWCPGPGPNMNGPLCAILFKETKSSSND